MRIFQKKSKESADFDEVKNEKADNEPLPGGASTNPTAMSVAPDDTMPIVRESAQLPNATVTSNPAAPVYESPMVKEKIPEDIMPIEKGVTKTAATTIDDIKPDDKLGYDYNFRYINTVNQQLLKGGVHLAGLLNEIFK